MLDDFRKRLDEGSEAILNESPDAAMARIDYLDAMDDLQFAEELADILQDRYPLNYDEACQVLDNMDIEALHEEVRKTQSDECIDSALDNAYRTTIIGA